MCAVGKCEKMCMLRYYHYTDRNGLRGILKSRKIQMSSYGTYGEGVYFTRFSPRHGRWRIARNNWDGVWRATEAAGKVDYTICVLLPQYKVHRYDEIYVLRQNVDIDDTKYRLFSVDGDHRKLEKKYSYQEDSDSDSSSSESDSSSSESDSSSSSDSDSSDSDSC